MIALPKVVIVGGGFAGLGAARALRSAPVDVTVVDRRNYHLFQPLLYQVATGSLSDGEVAAPLRGVLGRQRNTRVLLAPSSRTAGGMAESPTMKSSVATAPIIVGTRTNAPNTAMEGTITWPAAADGCRCASREAAQMACY